VAPTREIAVQGCRVALDVGGFSMPDLKVQTFIGGISVAQDQMKLKRCHIAIGTPGFNIFSFNFLK
jgi:ATP-dependent RNA helicase DDX20